MPELRYTREALSRRLTWEDLDHDYLRQLVGLAKIEDLAGAGLAARPERLGDVTTALMPDGVSGCANLVARERSEEHTSELQSHIAISYAVFCLDRKSVV